MSNHIDRFVTGDVLANSVDNTLTPIVPDGVRLHVNRFGCCCMAGPADAKVVLEWGSAGDWREIRQINGTFELDIDRTFRGDGVKRFRLRRFNATGAPVDIAAWFSANQKG